MGDHHVAATVPTFPVALYVILISYFSLLLVPFKDLLNVLAYFHVVKLSSAYVFLILVIKLTQKLFNTLTHSSSVVCSDSSFYLARMCEFWFQAVSLVML
jgi:hypothetical protein